MGRLEEITGRMREIEAEERAIIKGVPTIALHGEPRDRDPEAVARIAALKAERAALSTESLDIREAEYRARKAGSMTCPACGGPTSIQGQKCGECR